VSGVHPSLAGMAAGLLVPAATTCSDSTSEAGLFIGGVTFPADPPAASEAAAASEPSPPTLAASWSYFDQQLLENSNAPAGEQDFRTSAATAATWPDLYIRYQALIEQ